VHKNLENIYSSQVRGKNSILLTPSSGPSFTPFFEKDPQNQKLENDLVNMFNSVLSEEEKINPTIKPETSIGLKTYSFEDALKELYELEKKSNNF
jgi:hypothetical protein